MFQGSYSSQDLIVDLLQMPDGASMFCTLYWIYGRMTETGPVTPGIKTQLSEGTWITLDLNTNGSIQVVLEGDGLLDTYTEILFRESD